MIQKFLSLPSSTRSSTISSYTLHSFDSIASYCYPWVIVAIELKEWIGGCRYVDTVMICISYLCLYISMLRDFDSSCKLRDFDTSCKLTYYFASESILN